MEKFAGEGNQNTRGDALFPGVKVKNVKIP